MGIHNGCKHPFIIQGGWGHGNAVQFVDDSCDVNRKKPGAKEHLEILRLGCLPKGLRTSSHFLPLVTQTEDSVVPIDFLTDSSASAAPSFLASRSDGETKQQAVQLIDYY